MKRALKIALGMAMFCGGLVIIGGKDLLVFALWISGGIAIATIGAYLVARALEIIP